MIEYSIDFIFFFGPRCMIPMVALLLLIRLWDILSGPGGE